MLPSAVGLPVSILCTTSAAPVFAHLGHRPPESDLHSRQSGDVKPLILERHQGSYFVRTKVGYPGQILSLQLRNDAGAITYVPSSNASTCISGECTMGALDASLSMTLCPTADNFSWVPSTGAGSLRAEGSWFRDAIELTDLAIANFSMGIAYDLNTDSGVLGLGSPSPSTKSLGDGLIWALVEQGVATTEAFSVWLAGWSNHIDTGSLLFGAIDANKYSGNLKSVDMVYRDTDYQGPRILLSYVKASSQSGDDILMRYEDDPSPVALKLGTAFSMLPQPLAEAIWQVAGAEWLEECNCPAVPCRLSEGYGTFVYGFAGRSGPEITMHLRSMVVEQEVQDLRMNNTAGEPLCAFSIINGSNPSSYNIGEDFLRNAYAVFDLRNNEVALAQARMDSDALNNSKLVPFAGHGAPIPSARAVTEQPMGIPTSLPTSTFFSSIMSTYAAASGFGQVIVSNPSESTPIAVAGGSNGEGSNTHNVASDVGVATSATLVGVLSAAVAYTIYYHKKKLQLKAKGMLSTPSPEPEPQQSGVDLVDPESRLSSQSSLHVQTNTSGVGDAAPAYHLAVMSATSAQVSIQEGEEAEPKSPTISAQVKVKGHTSDQKVLGTWATLRRTQSQSCASGSSPNAESSGGHAL